MECDLHSPVQQRIQSRWIVNKSAVGSTMGEFGYAVEARLFWNDAPGNEASIE